MLLVVTVDCVMLAWKPAKLCSLILTVWILCFDEASLVLSSFDERTRYSSEIVGQRNCWALNKFCCKRWQTSVGWRPSALSERVINCRLIESSFVFNFLRVVIDWFDWLFHVCQPTSVRAPYVYSNLFTCLSFCACLLAVLYGSRSLGLNFNFEFCERQSYPTGTHPSLKTDDCWPLYAAS